MTEHDATPPTYHEVGYGNPLNPTLAENELLHKIGSLATDYAALPVERDAGTFLLYAERLLDIVASRATYRASDWDTSSSIINAA